MQLLQWDGLAHTKVLSSSDGALRGQWLEQSGHQIVIRRAAVIVILGADCETGRCVRASL